MPYPSSHRVRYNGTTFRKVSFQFTKGVAQILSHDRFDRDYEDLEATVPLSRGTKIKWVWPEDSAAFVQALQKRGNSKSKPVEVHIGGTVFAQLDWGSGGYGNDRGQDIAKTISKCYEAGLDVEVENMPPEYAQPQQSRKRPLDEAAETQAKARRAEGRVWVVTEDAYCKYSSNDKPPKVISTHLTQADADQRARAYWTRDVWGVDGLTEMSAPGEPYHANACVEYGAGIMTVCVEQRDVADLGAAMVKKALKLRGASVEDGGPHVLRHRLSALLGA